VIGLLILAVAGGVGGGCPVDGLFVDEPEGWTLQRDGANGCAWTLFNERGERAPEELYEGLFEGLPIEPPSPVLLYPLRLLGIGAIVCSLTGIVILVARIRAATVRVSDGAGSENRTRA
jgi:hypothetical protein